MSVTVSGIINTYNRPELLRGAIASALAQTKPLFELIVVDDCSPAELAPVVAAFGDRVRHLRLPRNGGPSAARNAGVEAASGEVVAFLDDDDEWLPEKLARQLAPLAQGYEACLCGWQRLGGDFRQVRSVDEVTEEMLRPGNVYCGGTGLVARRAALLEEPFDVRITQGEDWDVYVRLAQRRPLAYVREALYLFRYSDDHTSMTQSSRRESPQQLLARAAVLTKHRQWLGERHYRNRLAGYLLNSISRRPAKHRYLWHAIRQAGLQATMHYLTRQVFRPNRQRA